MKIKINESEVYEIKFSQQNNSEISWQEFQEILSRLNNVNKMFSKGNIDILNLAGKSDKPLNKIIKRKSHKRDWCNNKEKVLKILKIHYLGNKNKKIEFAKKNDVDWNDVVRAVWGLRKKHNILPIDIGLKEFPKSNLNSKQLNKLKI
jgi:hypothetical protein